MYALNEPKGGDVLRIRKKVGCWFSNPFRRSDRFRGKEDNPSPPHPTYENNSNEEKDWGGGEYKGIESAPYVNGSPCLRTPSEVRPYGPTRDHNPPRLPLRHVAAPQV